MPSLYSQAVSQHNMNGRANEVNIMAGYSLRIRSSKSRRVVSGSKRRFPSSDAQQLCRFRPQTIVSKIVRKTNKKTQKTKNKKNQKSWRSQACSSVERAIPDR